VEDEDHYVVTDSFRESFVGELSPPFGTGKELAKGIIGMLESKGINVDEMYILGGDSTAANTGRFIGAMAEVEKLLGRRFHCWICTLHLTELPICHLIKMYLGEKSGPNSFKSGLGRP
jgi:hypothetical protein